MFGEVDFTHDLDGIIVSKTNYVAGMYMPRHVHHLPYISLVLEGSYTKIRADGPHNLSHSMVAFHPAGEVHADCIHGSRASTLNFEFRARALPSEFSAFRGREIGRLSKTLLDAVFEGANEGRAIRALVDYICSALARASAARDFIAKVHASTCAFDCPESVSALARRLGIHRAHLHRVFSKACGHSLREQRARTRARLAAKLLATQLPLADIALECGYYDQSQFCRQFKKTAGMTPSTFRARFFSASDVTIIQDVLAPRMPQC